MKKMLGLLVILTLASAVFAEDAKPKILSGDLDAGLYISQYGADVTGGYEAVGFLASLLSLRGGMDLAVRYHVLDFVGVGGSVGLYALNLDLGGGATTFIDLPLRGLVRVGFSGFAVEAHAGTYVGFVVPSTGSLVSSNLNGAEFGLKALLGGFFLDYSKVVGTYSYDRIGLGFQSDDVFGF